MTRETGTIRSYELVEAGGQNLPTFSAGAHIGIAVPTIGIRRYSLINSVSAQGRYVIAIARDAKGKGGSKLLHRLLKPGAIARISRPRNDFPLAASGAHCLIAGGIGITPMLAMAEELATRGDPFHLHLLVRSADDIPFHERIETLVSQGQATVHLSAETGRADLRALVGTAADDRHAYCCGSAGLIGAFQSATQDWPRSNVHFEAFVSPPGEAENLPFEVTIKSTGETVQVSSRESLLDALKRCRVPVDSSCEIGSCGTCKLRFLQGHPLHRDLLLTDTERKTHLLSCVSRAEGTTMVLDL
ncbi:PDR/VanB family oxidoreductase [Salipiger sp. PrR002]|uniref:PDR/VanB family oxidoreductase n=1 Tax=Salipiger sp. PrR002 TaxID=2706489 RepID=UPI0013BCD4D8|nr:oxidoreductase [Salipiger sp. PrR002]NDW56781.1 oxidoreductase [Salipiger sp. PrR004]